MSGVTSSRALSALAWLSCVWPTGRRIFRWGPLGPTMADAADPAPNTAPPEPRPSARALLPLTLTTIGVVYGDIGTSPLYTIRECFFGTHSVAPTYDNVLGVLSLVLY